MSHDTRFPTMWYVRPTKAHTSLRVSDQSLCKSLAYSTTVKILTEHIWSFKARQEAAQACLSLHLSKCHIVGNHMSQLKCKGADSNGREWKEKVKLAYPNQILAE